jgi:hypothetical protein
MSNIEPEVPINYQALVDQHIAAVQAMHDALMAQLGGGVFIGPVSRRKLAFTAGLPDKFFRVVSGAVDEDPALAAARPEAHSRLRNIVTLSGAVRTLRDFHERLARSSRETDLLRRSEAGEDGLRVYNVAKSYNRTRDPEQLSPRVKEMKEALGARGNRSLSAAKKKKDDSQKDDKTVTPKETK